ncbi:MULTISPECIES: hypothetical protein [Dehalogenimonas]|jgi:hypothetical protein|uniref:Reductive dehalogenase anchoring protein n=2 Tax=Dehalogenimonas TaxID=670486 RepID=A0A0W0GGH3_9CHLR|nr:hypothetical protein [Dehalogenimonas alkenigignens]KTB47658.1 hypothetical protein DEALK_05030 [Dehalogenimonas alkenigignens]PVV84071.1 hypothetical protein DD509_05225 [Dehalogenimonas alkenigignens]
MIFVLFFFIMVAGYAFLEYYFRKHGARVTMYDRFVGGVGGILLLTGLWVVLDQRDQLDPPASYVFITITMLPAIALGAAAWLAITRRH